MRVARGRLVAVIAVLAGTLAGCSSQAPPSNHAIGLLDAPGENVSSYTIMDGHSSTPVASNGQFTLPSVKHGASLLAAIPPSHQHVYLAVLPSGDPNNSDVRVSAASTAQALIFLSPALATGTSISARSILNHLAALSGIAPLSQLINRTHGVDLNNPNSDLTDQIARSTESVLISLAKIERRYRSHRENEADRERNSLTLRTDDRLLSATSTTACESDQPVEQEIFDDTAVAVSAASAPNECDLTVSDTGPGSQPVGGLIPPIVPAWIASVDPLSAAQFTSDADLQQEVTNTSNSCNTFGTSMATGTEVVMPPLSYVDWLTNPIASLVTTLVNSAYSPPNPGTISISQSPGALYLEDAFSGGGSWTGPNSINPLRLNDSCLDQNLFDGPLLSSEAEVLNFVIILLDAVSPIVNLSQTVKDNYKCVTDVIEGAVGPIARAVGDSGSNNTDPISIVSGLFLNDLVPLSTGLVGCAEASAASDALDTFLTKAADKTWALMTAAADEAGTVLVLGNLEEYSYAVEGNVVPVDSPFTSTTTTSPPSSTTSPMSNAELFVSVPCMGGQHPTEGLVYKQPLPSRLDPYSACSDDHSYFDGLKWTVASSSATATGTYYDVPLGPLPAEYSQATIYPITLDASHPETCAVGALKRLDGPGNHRNPDGVWRSSSSGWSNRWSAL